MANDLEAGKRLELDWLAGKVIALGRKYGISTPGHEAVYAILKPYRDGARTKTSGSPVAIVIESLLRGLMRISAPGDCNHALRQSSGALAVQIGLLMVIGGPVATAQARARRHAANLAVSRRR